MLRSLLLRPFATITTATAITTTFKRSFSQKKQPPHITVLFETPEGDKITCLGKKGDSILDVAHENDVELEGACESSLACSTCHVILEEGTFNQLPEPSDEENDLLDLAFGLTETSRLGCQVKLDESLEGIKVKLPAATRNMAVDGYKPKPH